MDRQIIYAGAIPLETDLLNTNKNALVGLSKLTAAVLGTSSLLNGFTCIPTGVPSLQIQVTAGEIYSLQNVDGTAYSSLALDTTHQIVKQGVSLDTVLLTTIAPATSGQSINYLVQVAYQDVDSGAVVLPYYNASNPSVAYSGPANAGTTNNTVRKGVATVSIKAGIAATTGSQITPSPDSGYVGAFVVTVANGQTTVTALNISTLSTATFVTETLTQKLGITNSQITANAGGTADALTATFTPSITTLVNGMSLIVRAAYANATTTPTFTVSGLASKSIVKGSNLPLVAGDIAGAGHWVELQYDLAFDKWVIQNPATGVISISPASIQGAFKNLQASATGLSAIVTVTADEIAVESASNTYQTLRAVNLSIAGTVSGAANGLDAGALAISTWYSVWVIWNGTTTAGLLSLSATAPTLPSGYTHKARVGWIRTDASGNKYPLSFTQNGRLVYYKTAAGSNLTIYPTILTGLQGSFTVPTWVSASISTFAPPTAQTVLVSAAQNLTGASSVAIHPNNSIGALNVAANRPLFLGGTTGSPAYGQTLQARVPLESSNIYVISDSASTSILAQGWEDNI